MADRVTFRLRGVNRRRDDDDTEYVQDEGFVDVRPGHLNLRLFPAWTHRTRHREYLENTGNRLYTRGNGVSTWTWPLTIVRDSNYYRQLWTRIAADWRLFAAQDFVNTIGTMVYLPLRRAVRGFTRRWRARNQWRLNIPGIPMAARVWDAGLPLLGRRAQGGESGLIGYT